MSTIKIVNVETGQEIEREMNAEELEQLEAHKAASEAQKQQRAENEAKRAVLLEKLGITEEEAKLLLG